MSPSGTKLKFGGSLPSVRLSAHNRPSGLNVGSPSHSGRSAKRCRRSQFDPKRSFSSTLERSSYKGKRTRYPEGDMYREASAPPHCQPLEMRSCSSCSVMSEPAGSALPPKSPVGAEADDPGALGLLWPFPACFAAAGSAVPRHRQTKQATPDAISCSTSALH